MRKLSLWCLGLGILAFLPMSWLGFFLSKIIFISLGLSLWFLTSRNKKIYCKEKILWAVAAYFSVLIIFTIFSAAPVSSFFGVSEAMQGLETQILYLGIFLMALTLNNYEEKYLFKGIVLLHVVIGIYALLQWLNLDLLQHFWDKDAFISRTFSFLGNPNWLAAFMVLTMPFLFRASKRWWVILIFEWLVLFSTGSKAGFVAAAILMGIIFWKAGKKKIIAVIAACLISGAGVLFLLFPNSTLLLRSTNGREVIWHDTVKMLESNPLGHGLDIFRFSYPAFSTPDLYKYEDFVAAVDHPHNQILQILFEIGPLGLILFLLCLILIFRGKKSEINFDLKLGVLCYLLTNLFGFEVISSGIMFWLILGILAKTENAAHINSIFKRTSFISLGLLFLAIGWLNLHHLYANFYYEKSWEELATGNATISMYNIEKAIAIYPYDRIYLLQASETLLALKTSTPRTLEVVDHYLSFADKLAKGLDAEVTLLRAWEFAEKGDVKSTEIYFNKAMVQQPYSFRNYFIGFEIYKILKQPEKVKTLREEFKKILPDYWNKPETAMGHIFQKSYPWIKPEDFELDHGN